MLSRLRTLLAERKNIVTLGAQGIVVDDAQRVLLVRHGYRPGWHFPGGGVERGEEIETAITREVLEETGVIVLEPPKLIGIYSHFEDYPGDHIVLFRIDRWRRDTIPAPNAEIAEHGFFALDALPDPVSPGTARRLAEVFGNAAQSSAW